jgi:SAM-dependent methyltransferase
VSFRPTVQAWDAHAESWAKWARTPNHDYYYEQLNLPYFLDLLPAPRRLTVDLACGEGRLGRVLAGLGHDVVGVDSSPTLVRLAHDAGGHREVLEATADSVPLPDGCADLVTIFMALQDMDDLEGPIGEAARLLGADGRLCVAVAHPFAEMTRMRTNDPGYFTPHRYIDCHERDNISMSFESWRRPLCAYMRALEQSGFLVEALREPIPGDEAIGGAPSLAKWLKQPIFLHIRALIGSR